METLQTLQRRLVTTGKLQGIVKSMKTLSAVSIRQYEKAVASLENYFATIELGLQVVLKEHPVPAILQKTMPPRRALVIFGSDQGLCGRFNEKLADSVTRCIRDWHDRDLSSLRLLVIGARIGARLEAAGYSVDEQYWVPGSVTGINPNVYQTLLLLEQWRHFHQITHIDLFFNKHAPGTASAPVHQPLLPLDNINLLNLAGKPWQGRSLPLYRIPADRLFSALVRQYLFVSLFQAQAQSLASEQASRLRSLQNAEKNIVDHVEELRAQYRLKRQATITSELLDLVAGFKTSINLAGRKKKRKDDVAAESDS